VTDIFFPIFPYPLFCRHPSKVADTFRILSKNVFFVIQKTPCRKQGMSFLKKCELLNEGCRSVLKIRETAEKVILNPGLFRHEICMQKSPAVIPNFRKFFDLNRTGSVYNKDTHSGRGHTHTSSEARPALPCKPKLIITHHLLSGKRKFPCICGTSAEKHTSAWETKSLHQFGSAVCPVSPGLFAHSPNSGLQVLFPSAFGIY